MVFESLVTDLLNKHLGQYVVNLDPSQLKIGIWGGNVKLENLELKATALDDLDLPIQVVRGYLGKLHLSIPWKSLYTEPTVVLIEDVFVLAKPNQDVTYDAAKEEKAKLEKRQKQLEKLEDARKLEEKKKKGKGDESSEEDSFAEKLATQVIKNLQITIKSIHVRYEDASSNPTMPFSIGLTLRNLSAQTTDENFIPKTIKDTVSIIHKLVVLDSLAVYWNVKETLTTLPWEEWISHQRKMVDAGSETGVPATHTYVLNPFSASTKVKINTKPGLNNTLPKIFVALMLENFGLDFTKLQYHSLVELLDAMSRMSRNVPFRKYRPSVKLEKHISTWWQYAYNAILEEHVRREARMWSWEHIKEYRAMCKLYQSKYMDHLQHPSKAISSELEKMECVLNLVSITIHRQLALNEVLAKKQLAQDKKGSSGWFGGMFSKKSPKAVTGQQRIEALMPEKQQKEEMEKLYKAIGYAKNEVIQPFAKDYIAVKAMFHLKEIAIGIVDDSQGTSTQVTKFAMKDLVAEFHQRPSASAVKVSAKVDSLTLTGASVGGVAPVMVRSIQKESGSDENLALIHAVFETNPLGKSNVDQSIEAAVQPIEVVYDSHTVEQLIKFVQAPEDVVLHELQEKAFSTFQDLRVSSTAGLIHAMDQHNVMDVNVMLNASYLIIPEHGLYSKSNELLIIDFGSLSVISDGSHQRVLDPKHISEAEVKENCFDRFDISLKAVQVLLAKSDDNWQEARELMSSSLHILFPIAFNAKLAKSLVPDDPQLPQFIIDGELQSLTIKVTDEKMIRALKLFESIPIPGGDKPEEQQETQNLRQTKRAKSTLSPISEETVDVLPQLAVSALQMTQDGDADVTTPPLSPLTNIEESTGPEFLSGIANQVKVELSFRILEVLLSIGLDSVDDDHAPTVELHIEQVSSNVKLRRWDLFVDARVGRLALNDLSVATGSPTPLLTTPKDKNMLHVKYRKCFFNGFLTLGLDWIGTDEAKRATIHYRDEFDATDQLLNVQFAMLAVVLHQEALFNIMRMADAFNKRIIEHAKEAKQHLKAARRSASRLSLSTSDHSPQKHQPDHALQLQRAAFEDLKSSSGVIEETELLVSATMDGFSVKLTSSIGDLVVAYVQGLSTKVQLKPSKTEVVASMKDLHVTYCNDDVLHKQIVSMNKDEVFDLEVVQYNNAASIGPLHPDVSLGLKIGQINLLLLRKFLVDVLDFVDDFQVVIVAMKAAGQVVAESATEKVADYNRTSPKVQFRVTIRAPVIIIPVKSSSNTALIADLGNLKLHNQFEAISCQSETGDDAVTDVMSLKLEDLSIVKALIENSSDITNRRVIVHPVNLEIKVVRNLSPWCHAIPDITASGSLESIQVSASQDDIRTAVDVLYGNLQEGVSNTEEGVSESFLTHAPSPDALIADIVSEGSDQAAVELATKEEETSPWVKTSFSFKMVKVMAALYRSPADMTSSDEFAERALSDCLTQFIVGGLETTGSISSNNTMNISLSLEDIDLDDVRGRCHESATKMIQFQSSAADGNVKDQLKKMLSVKFEQKETGDKFVDVKLRSVAIILNIEFITALSDMVTSTLPEASATTAASPKRASPPKRHGDAATNAMHVTATNDVDWPTTKLHVVCHKPRVILLADATAADSRAIFLETELSFTFFEKYGNQKMVALVSQTEVTCAPLSEQRQSHLSSTVMSLAQLDLHSSNPPNGKPHMTVSATKMVINLSPATIHTIAMAFKSLPAKKSDDHSEASTKDLSNLWEIDMTRTSDVWYLAPVDDDKLVPGCMVWCRNRLGDYEYGFLSQKDTHCTVLFHPEGQITHRCAETVAMVLDNAALQETKRDFVIGENVIARATHSEHYVVGFVKKTSVARGKEAMLSIETSRSSSSSSSGSSSTSSNSSKDDIALVPDAAATELPAGVLIQLIKNNKEVWAEMSNVIPLPKQSRQVVPGVGALVFARWKTGVYHRGRVRAHKDFKCIVYLTDLEESLSHDLDDYSAVVFNTCPPVEKLKAGARVICGKQNSKWYYPGSVRGVREEDGGIVYHVQLEDGDVVGVPLGRICLLPMPNTDTSPGVGCYVYARVASGSPNYEKGVVLERGKKVLVKLVGSGERLSVPLADADAVVWNITPAQVSLSPRIDVIATREEKSVSMTRGVVREVNTMNAGRPLYRVEFWDGKLLWVSASRMRVVQSSEACEIDGPSASEARREQIMVNFAGISVRLEGYLGGQIMPLLQLETKVHAEIKDWSTKLVANADATAVATYYNETVAEWEHLIEPVSDNTSQRPWELSIQMETAADELSSDGPGQEEDATAPEAHTLLQTPMATLKVESYDVLEVTITKRSLLVMRTLGNLFSDAVMAAEPPLESKVKPPFVITNQLGIDAKITPGQLLMTANDNGVPVPLAHGCSVALNLVPRPRGVRSPKEKEQQSKPRMPTVTFQVDGFHPVKDVSVKRQRRVIYDLIPLNLLAANPNYSVVVQVDASDGQRIITIRSPLQLINHFPIPIDVMHLSNKKEVVKDATVHPQTTFSVPVALAYHCGLLLRPAGHGYKECKDAVKWNDFKEDKKQKTLLAKSATDDNGADYYFEVVREEQQYTTCRGGLVNFAPRYTLHCHPSIVLHNYLPSDIQYKTQGMSSFETLKGGDRWPLFAVNCAAKPVVEVKLCKYKGHDWLGSFTAKPLPADEPTTTFTLTSENDAQSKQEVALYMPLLGSLSVTLFSPYWIVNKSGKSLEYQASGESSVVEHAGADHEPLLMVIRGNKKKMRMRVKDCDWSEVFPVDTIGSGGSLSSGGKRGQTFEVGVDIQLSYFSLTKIVTLAPRHMLANHTTVAISLAEADAQGSEWHNISPGETVPFWPAIVPPRSLYINVAGRESVRFDPLPVTSLLLKIDNEFGGVCATYQEKDSVSLLSFAPYFPGAAPVRIESDCQHVGLISYRQSASTRSYVVCFGQSVLYTWEMPAEEHQLTCSVVDATSDSTTAISIDKNEFGRMQGDGDTAVYWVTFLDGLQRVLLFTEDFRVAYRASQEQTLRPTQEVMVELEGLGLSLVDSEKKLELAYVGIRKSDVVWEERGKNRWKALRGKTSLALETHFQKKQLKDASSSTDEFARLAIEDLEVDLNRMIIVRPTKSRIRRTFHSGISLKYIISPNLMQVYAKINTIQIDSQIPGSTFQTVLHAVAPPKSIAAENAPKPLFEFSLTSRVGEKRNVNEINYLKLLVQEMDVRIDKGFLLGVIDFFGSQQQRMTEAEQYQYDIDVVKRKLEDSSEFKAVKQVSRFYFNYFHMSPLKVHVSFSMLGGPGHSDHAGLQVSQLHTNVLNLLMQSVGVAFTEVQDVEFKLACFEVQSMLLSQQQLVDSVVKHYQHQALKQLYVLVLGLDVLGNPFGLISGITVGAKNFFYEPYQGLIQGPEEFAEGLALGVKSLVGGTVGGAAGAVSRITGTFGKGLAALTLDDEYQLKRRREMSQRPTNVGQGLVKGGKGFVRGVVSGVTGIVTKPVEGAKKGGAGGFFKGVGKGLIGVVARPTGGLVDFASSTFEGLKSTAGGSTAIAKLRPPRVFHADKVLRPFHEYESFGYNVLMEVDKERFASTDSYMAHAQVDGSNVIIVTNGHVIYASKGDILSEWTTKWFLAFREMRDDVGVDGKTLTLNLVLAKKREGLFSKATSARTVKFDNAKTATWFAHKITEAIML